MTKRASPKKTDLLVYESSQYIIQTVLSALDGNQAEEMAADIETIIGAKKIFIYGVGRSGLVGKAFAMRLMQLGLKAYFIGETITPIMHKGDVTFIMSNTGSTVSAIQVANISRRIGADVIVLTAKPTSKLGNAASLILELSPKIDQDKLHLAPLGTLFEDSAMIFLDGLIAELMRRKGESDKTMRKRHAISV